MVLVAAIAAGVLINTAGFLQSSAEQTGQESSDQVTNQVQIASKTGIVDRGSSGVDGQSTVIFNTTEDGRIAADSQSTVEVNFTSETINGEPATSEVLLDDTLAISDGNTLTLEENGDSVSVTNEDTGASADLTTGADGLSITGNSSVNETVRLTRDVDDAGVGTYVLQSAEITAANYTGGSINPADVTNKTALLETGANNEQYIPVNGSEGTSVIIDDGETLTVNNDPAAGTAIQAGGESMEVQGGDGILVEIAGTDSIDLINQRSGATVTFSPYQSNITNNSVDTVQVATEDGDVLTLDLNGLFPSAFEGSGLPGGSDHLLVNGNYQVSSQTQINGVGELELVAIKGSGADQINFEETTITTIGPGGTSTLTYDSDEAVEADTFTLEAIQDNDGSLPVMTDSDRFRVVIDPGTLETGESVILEMTTEAGATTEIRVAVPNTLSGETAVPV
jgi:flagellin FlaA/flagellin FlaB